ncbi:hypothetical protein HIM_01030 [Hirsutella minnesotensis 3608]|nr:hypothetical protein HIM_01030 [Hirsutella minnesotensis 3608]
MDGAGSARQRQKLQKKLDRKATEEKEELEGGKQTRRKRFIDPDSSFGKNSMVYRIKHGDLKDKLGLPAPERPRDKTNEPRAARGLLPGQWLPKESQRWSSPDRARSKVDISTRRPSWDRIAAKNSGSGNWAPAERKPIATEILDNPSALAPVSWGPEKPLGRARELQAREYRLLRHSSANSLFIYGRDPVKQVLQVGKRNLYRLYIYGGPNRKATQDDEAIAKMAEERGIPVETVPLDGMGMMSRMSGGRPHNGLVLEAGPLPQRPIISLGKYIRGQEQWHGYEVILAHQSKEEKRTNSTDNFVHRAEYIRPNPLVLLLNGVVDPGNLGALIRTAGFFGADGVAITTHNSATLTSTALKASAGAAEEMTIFSVSSALQFLEESRKNGWEAYAAVGPPSGKLKALHPGKFITVDDVAAKSPLNEKPCILVLGNEGQGLSKMLKAAVDYEVSIPRLAQFSKLDSLNEARETKAREEKGFENDKEEVPAAAPAVFPPVEAQSETMF